MYKNQLQELAQRSCFNLPAYSCLREGPDHAPRFKATVNFNGEIFESPNHCTTLRQAEHAAAEVALNTLSRRGLSQSLAGRILDETGVCKNLLQETAQRVGASLPVYTTIRSGPGHLPVFKCIVDVAGMTFVGESAKTKKQAEKNAAMAAWSAIRQLSARGSLGSQALLEPGTSGDGDYSSLLGVQARDDKAAGVPYAQSTQPSHAPVVQNLSRRPGVRLGISGGRTSEGSSSVQFHSGSSQNREGSYGHFHSRSLMSMTSGETTEAGQQGQRLVFNQQQHAGGSRTGSTFLPMMQRRSQSSSSGSGSEAPLLSREAIAASRAGAAGMATGSMMGRVMPVQVRAISMNNSNSGSRSGARNEVKVPSEEYQKDDEEWLRGETPRSSEDGDHLLGSTAMNLWSRSSRQQNWGSQPPSPASSAAAVAAFGLRPATSMAPPVRVRQMVAVCSAAPPRRHEPALPPRRHESSHDPARGAAAADDGEAAVRQALSQLKL